MNKEIKDLTIEQLAEFFERDCNDCPLYEIKCGAICCEVNKILKSLKEKDEKDEEENNESNGC